ncbi:unnamed protein product, partial [Vitis vinifera]
MDFFKSVFSDDPDPPRFDPDPESPKKPSQSEEDDAPDAKPDPNPNPSAGGGWSFGGLIKTLTTKSESVIEIYRRDLQEFGTGLKHETAAFLDTDTDENAQNHSNQGVISKPFSRFDAQVRAIQNDVNTYVEEPEDLDDYNKWKLEFVLDDKGEEIQNLLEENGAMEGIYNRIVPKNVDQETFWFRYFYRVYKLKQAEDVRASLVKRAIMREDEEELSWDVEDEDEDDETTREVGGKNSEKMEKENRELGNKDYEKIVKKEERMNYPANRDNMRKRLSAADEEEDLNWDIEDDDEPVKNLKGSFPTLSITFVSIHQFEYFSFLVSLPSILLSIFIMRDIELYSLQIICRVG